MIVSPLTPKEWVSQARASIHEAISKSGFPVAFHEVSAFPGHIGRARRAGFSAGNHPYVTFVDDDDYVMPNAFSCLQSALDARPKAIFTRETVLQNGMMGSTDRRHHLAVYRRDIVESFDFEAWPAYDAMALRTHAEGFEGDVIDLEDAVYVYRLRGDSPARKIQREHPELLRKARG